jgi:hypothetical protein
LAEEHQLTQRAGRELLDNLVSLITKHLKKGERIRIAGLGILIPSQDWRESDQGCDRDPVPLADCLGGQIVSSVRRIGKSR